MILINVNRSDKVNEKESYLERSSRTDTIQSKGTVSCRIFRTCYSTTIRQTYWWFGDRPLFRGGGWHLGTVPMDRAPKGPRAMAVIAATDGGSMISLNNFHRLIGMNYCDN